MLKFSDLLASALEMYKPKSIVIKDIKQPQSGGTKTISKEKYNKLKKAYIALKNIKTSE